VVDYRRSVDFRTGEASVRWNDERGSFARQMFVSRADGVAVLAITGPGPGAVSCRLRIEPRKPSEKLDAEEVLEEDNLEEVKVMFARTAAKSILKYLKL